MSRVIVNGCGGEDTPYPKLTSHKGVEAIARSRYTANAEAQQRVNEEIRSRQIRLIDDEGNQVGIINTADALTMAQEKGLDLVEVAPNANPPVCRLMDFGKFMYNKSKRERQAKKAQTKVEVKEIQLRPKTGQHDIDFKVRDARRWLNKGAKVKVRIRFRGREVTHPEVARDLMAKVADTLKDVAVIEQEPAFEGRAMLMILGPAKATKN